eukprot:CAMPEP_0172568810 /NCGR_PEP_ID=MMETSP1067-20121228/121190_1 /TAXON_ID=265564 ORGANISM="Thalassiosira punctigera, Strain Tpunct2005C2" /NCGR_SAMPLE_ID=MMETSP1067 /ASSEMBLY_ACC=CAM_ASM_000444 /LENGTH=46 /DNA_ID= /DNA_START= /DNA_END= /DNA_ORIENTATION=
MTVYHRAVCPNDQSNLAAAIGRSAMAHHSNLAVCHEAVCPDHHPNL